MLEVNEEKLRKIIFDGRNHEPGTGSYELAEQKEGLSGLYAFLYKDAAVDKLRPFLLDFSSKTVSLANRVNPSYLFYLGGNNKYLNLTIPSNIVGACGGIACAIPRYLVKGDTPYYWLEFYNPNYDNESSKPFWSGRLNPDQNGGKTNFGSWHGIEEELLADYILGENGLVFEDVLPVDISPKAATSLANYRLGGRMNLTLRLYENSLINAGDDIRLTPKRDEQKIYEWLEVTKNISDLPAQKLPLISSYRLLHEKPFLIASGWYGYERQLLIDYLTNQGRVKFVNLRPIRAVMPSKLEYISIVHMRRTCGLNLEIYNPLGSIQAGEEVFISSQQDDQELYQWLEVYKTDPESHEPIGEPVTAVRLVDGKFQQKDWQGPNLQLLRDYAKEKVSFNNLRPISFTVGKGRDLIHLWREEGKRIYLVMSRDFNLQIGDSLTLIPEKESEDGTTFLLERSGATLARYHFDLSKMQFTCADNLAVNGDCQLTYDEKDCAYIDNIGNRLVTKQALVKKLQISHPTLYELLENVTPVNYKGKGNKSLTLYQETEVLAKAASRGISSLDNWCQVALDFQPDVTTRVFRDEIGEWLPKHLIRNLLGLAVAKSMKGSEIVRHKSVRGDVGQMVVYLLQDVLKLPEAKEFLTLPHTKNKTGILEDDQGRWAGVSRIASIYQMPIDTLKKYLGDITSKSGISKGRKLDLYNLDELTELQAFQDYLQRRKTQRESQRLPQNKQGAEQHVFSEDADEVLMKFFEEVDD